MSSISIVRESDFDICHKTEVQIYSFSGKAPKELSNYTDGYMMSSTMSVAAAGVRAYETSGTCFHLLF